MSEARQAGPGGPKAPDDSRPADHAAGRFDPTDPAHRDRVDGLVAAHFSTTASDEAEQLLSGHGDSLEAQMARLLTRSRQWLRSCPRPVKVAVVFAMWGEHNRLKPRSADNPNGEDSLAVKLVQLDEATRQTPVDWHLYAVDDGCPHDSFGIAREIARSHPLERRVTVLALKDALPAGSGPLSGLPDADDSRKAGAIILGAMRAIESGAEAVIYTDADSSVHLGQVGLLLQPFVEDGVPVILGNRKHPESVLVKDAARWGIGIKVLRHMQRMIGDAIFSRGILDTQAAFKLYESGLLSNVIADPTVYDFSFDTDWILAALRSGARMEQVPFSFIDSAAESASIAQGPMTTWETLLFGLARQVKRHGFREGHAAAMISVLEEEIRSHHDLDRLIDHLPPELESAGESDYGNPDLMAPEALRPWIHERVRA
jgi:hypothetical protein